MSLTAKEEKELLRLLELDLASSSLNGFMRHIHPHRDMYWHQLVLCHHIDQWFAGDVKRLMVFMPPQHTKSEHVSRGLPAYIFGHKPEAKIIASSYAAELIQGMNRDVQRAMETTEYHGLFPATRLNSANVRTVSGSYLRNNDIFEVVGHKGQYRCAGVGGGITGFPADYGIIDDPYKDYKEAMSPTVRRAVWEWYTSTFLSRTHNNSRILLTLTRWHEQDLAGKLLEIEGDAEHGGLWTVLKLPAICEDPTAPNEQRKAGEALWPERFDLEHLEQKRRLNAHQFRALYQQDPRPREGGLFPRSRFTDNVVGVAPIEAERVRYWDMAATEDDGDFTVGTLIAKDKEGLYYVEDVIRFRKNPTERNRIIRETAHRDNERYGRKVEIGGPQDPGAAGKEASQAFIRMLDGYRVYTERESGSKELRAEEFSAQVGVGNVKMVKAPWNEEFLAELETFPGGYADQVDSVCQAYNRLAGKVQRQSRIWVV